MELTFETTTKSTDNLSLNGWDRKSDLCDSNKKIIRY